MLYLFFRLCCGFITLISMITGYSYEEVNTFLFIYVEPLIILATAILIPIYGRKYLSNTSGKIIFGLSIIYILMLTGVIFPIWMHYSQFSMQIACERAYMDLDTLGRITGLGYVNINLFLFIVLFLFLLFLNIGVVILQRVIFRKSKAIKIQVHTTTS